MQVANRAEINMKRILGFAALGWMLVSSVTLASGGAPVLLDWGTVDTDSASEQAQFRSVRTARAAPEQRLSARGTAPYLVQFNDVIQESWKTGLTDAGAELMGYIPENAFLVLATPSQMAVIGDLPQVDWVGEYLPAYKKARRVRAMLAQGADSDREYNVTLFKAEDIDRIAQELAALPGTEITALEPLPDRGQIRVWLSPSAVDTVTGWGEVEWVSPYLKRQLWNDVAARSDMMNASNVWDTLGLTGAGQIIAVCDTGLDTGNTGTLHRDFTNRVTGFGWTNGNYSASYTWADYDAHGSHVCGSVLGNGTMSTGLYKGIAYEADLIMQSGNASLDGIPTDLNRLFQQAFDNGARIHSDSWGYDDDGTYSSDSRYLDMFTWSNQTMLVLVAAGNQGVDANSDGVVDYDSIGSPATAKNCLSVGAAESDRPEFSAYTWGSSWPSDFPANPIKDDEISGSYDGVHQGVAGFSSRGPCDDGRIKPDLMAPGTDIISTRSTRTSDTGWGVAPNTNYLYMGGTSMATPLTAGAAGLAREWLVTTGGITNPSAALLKGLMINGARNMSPGQYGTASYREVPATRPNNVQGFGHVDLFTTLKPATNQFLDLIDTNSLSTGTSNTFTMTISAASTNGFILTMAYSDYWATTGSGKKLVNDLDLTVRKPLGTTLYPNGLGMLDATNNVEMIEFVADEVGTYTVTVNARTVPSGSSQPYALVMRGPKDDAPSAPTFGSNPGPITSLVSQADSFMVSAGGNPIPTLALQSTTAGSGYSFTAGTGELAYTPPVGDLGAQSFTFTASNTLGVATQLVSVTVIEGPPVSPDSLWASVTNSTSFTAAWSSVTDATSYRLDVGTNAVFSGGGGGGGVQLGETFDSGLAGSYTTGNQTLTSGVWYTAAVYAEASGASRGGSGSAARLNDDTAGASLRTPALNTAGTVTFWVRELNSGGGDYVLQKSYDASAWVDVATQAFSGTTFVEYSHDVNDSASTIYLRVLNDDQLGHLIVDDFEVTSYAAASDSYVPGYSNRTVSGTSQSVTGLTAETTYYFRARTVSASGTSTNSGTVPVVTLGTGTPPVMDAIPDQVTGVGADFDYTVTATEGDGDSYLFACTSVVDEATWAVDTNGYFLFIPTVTEVGTNVFVFTATDKDGTSAPAQMSIRVNTQAATNAFEEWVQDRGEDPGSTNFTETADFDGDGMTTEEEYWADTDPTLASSLLELTGTYAIATGGGTGGIELRFPASTGRYYQLEYCTGLTNYLVGTTNLGWGIPGMTVTNDSTGTWYGVIRALLAAP
jgi:Subtilase family